MTRRPPRAARSGLTLAEILVAILIMGIGLVSVASLFPIGLLRIRDASRNQRSVLLMESATSEIESRNMLNKLSFTFSYYSNIPNIVPYDPWTTEGLVLASGGVNRATNPGSGPGLPVAYDPLWWAVMDDTHGLNPMTLDGRFGVGVDLNGNSLLGRGDPLQTQFPPSAYGLQRITNFLPFPVPAIPLSQVPPYGSLAGTIPAYSWDFTYPITNPSDPRYSPALAGVPDIAGQIFASQDDVVFQKEGVGASTTAGNSLQSGIGSPVVPDLSLNTIAVNGTPVFRPSNQWNYTWMFTGYQVEVRDWATFAGSVVLFHNRPIGTVLVPTPNGPMTVGADERVVEAIFGYSTSIDFSAGYAIGGQNVGYGAGDQRIVLVRWPATQEDPKGLAAGSFIADTTYERFQVPSDQKFSNFAYPAQRCYWYRIAKVTPAEPDPDMAAQGLNYRRKILTLATPVRARTLLYMNGNSVDAAFLNVATINPYVVNVVTKVFYAR
ncbi:MAG TPA: hypothetical protein VG406_15760 [Isosphaeraceae bacterium]|jgi:type II secretory pathway pseudopilin PulG|nr:hypothetical protein [Isosphaeraceae bacterium]